MLCLLAFAAAHAVDVFEPLEAGFAEEFGKRFVAVADQFEQPQIKIQADPRKANGVHVPDKVGVLVVPQKDLQESEELAAQFKTDKGAALGLLFMYHAVPVLDDKAVDVGQLRPVKFTDDDGKEHTVYALLLAVKQVAEGDYRLQAYGNDPKPLIDAKFSQEEGGNVAQPVAVAIKDASEDTQRGKLVVTVFGKYQASFPCGYKE